MQKEKSLIHVLYTQIRLLIVLLLSNFVKESALQKAVFTNPNISKLLENTDNFVELLSTDIGESAKTILSTLPKCSQ